MSTIAARPIPKPPVPGSKSLTVARIDQPVPPTMIRSAPADWGIQIGAFSGYTDAHIAAGNVARRLYNLPVTASLKIQPVDKTEDTLFRARLMGMDEASARDSCNQLVSNGQVCILVTPQGDELASLPQR